MDLFAKYCWDRVVELDSSTPNIYRKLGLMTAEHLRDYRETAAIYLRKALEMNENDEEVKKALGDFEELSDSPSLPAEALAKAGEAAAGSGSITQNLHEAEDHKTEDFDINSQQELEAIKNQQPLIIETAPASTRASENQQSKLVLITGAGSGIGRATAEIFARNGYRLILTGRRVERLVDLKSRFEAEFGTEILILPFDVILVQW